MESGNGRSSPVRVGVVDAHDLLLAGVRALMSTQDSPAQFVVGAKTVDDLLEARHDLDVVLLGVRLSDGTRPEDNVRRLAGEGVVVLLHADQQHREAAPAMQLSGAFGLVWKNSPAHTLLEALVTVGRGERWTPDDDGNPVDLTHRETEVLRLFASGLTYAETAAALKPSISIESVKTYLSRIRRRYGAASRHASTRFELRQRALEDGLLAPEPTHRDVNGPSHPLKRR